MKNIVLQREITEAKHDTTKFYKVANARNLSAARLEQAMADAASKSRERLQHRLVKLLPDADPKLGPVFKMRLKFITQRMLIQR